MKLPPDRQMLSHDSVAGARVAAVAEALLPWRVQGRLPGFYLDFAASTQERHGATRAHLVEQFEEATDVLACMSRPGTVPEPLWIHWGQAFQGLAKTPETLLELSGEEFRKFHLALWDFAHALGHPE